MDPSQAKEASFDRRDELRLPVLIANGTYAATRSVARG